MQKLETMLIQWMDGRKVRGIRTPPLETIQELIGIYNGTEKYTINSSVIEICRKCSIPFRQSGIGWEIIQKGLCGPV